MVSLAMLMPAFHNIDQSWRVLLEEEVSQL
jgi:hypothetical protein